MNLIIGLTSQTGKLYQKTNQADRWIKSLNKPTRQVNFINRETSQTGQMYHWTNVQDRWIFLLDNVQDRWIFLLDNVQDRWILSLDKQWVAYLCTIIITQPTYSGNSTVHVIYPRESGQCLCAILFSKFNTQSASSL